MSNELVGWQDSATVEAEGSLGFTYTFTAPPGGRPLWEITVDAVPTEAPRLVSLRISVGPWRPSNQQHVEDPPSEPEQKQPLQGSDGEAPAADPGVGSAGPLPNASLKKVEVIEGVGSDAQRDLKLLPWEGREMWLHLEEAVRAAREAGVSGASVTSETIRVTSERFTATCTWTAGGVAVATLAMYPWGELEDN